MKKTIFRYLLSVCIILSVASVYTLAVEIPFWPSDTSILTGERQLRTRTTTTGDSSQVDFNDVLSFTWFETTDTGKTFLITHMVSNTNYRDGEPIENPTSLLLTDLVLAMELDEDGYAVDMHGVEELDKRISSIPNPIVRQVLLNMLNGETLKNDTIRGWNEVRDLCSLALEEINQALEWEYDVAHQDFSLPFTYQLLGKEGLWEDQEVYVVQLNRFYTGNQMGQHIEEFMQSVLGMPLPNGVAITKVDISTFVTYYTDKNTLYPLAIEEYNYYDIALTAAGEIIPIKVEEKNITSTYNDLKWVVD